MADSYLAIQILIGIFHVFMWYFILILYMGQIKGTFGIYEPITYRTGCTLWGIVFIISGVFLIRVAKHPSQRLVVLALITNIFCVITTIIAVALTVTELSKFHSVSYKNYGQAKLGREVSRVLLFSYPLELALAFTYSIFGCIDLTVHLHISLAHDVLHDKYVGDDDDDDDDDGNSKNISCSY
ncbi:membrane-spanning 4-domains subfamily A member 13 [Pteropus alecto]|uniref:membrane-spanning 4-domains subfamily A member 13 n=1 Tax=Pteropus alecto TaxID=9402 RepID=UPI000D53C153|nr:membrane-spanning 4-domains subfamily A member 13 [Pteropus alecto]